MQRCSVFPRGRNEIEDIHPVGTKTQNLTIREIVLICSKTNHVFTQALGQKKTLVGHIGSGTPNCRDEGQLSKVILQLERKSSSGAGPQEEIRRICLVVSQDGMQVFSWLRCKKGHFQQRPVHSDAQKSSLAKSCELGLYVLRYEKWHGSAPLADAALVSVGNGGTSKWLTDDRWTVGT